MIEVTLNFKFQEYLLISDGYCVKTLGHVYGYLRLFPYCLPKVVESDVIEVDKLF